MKELQIIQTKLKAPKSQWDKYKDIFANKFNIQMSVSRRHCRLPQNPAVYAIINPEGEIYVGSSKNIRQRYGQYSANSFKGQQKLFKSFEKYGKCNHTFYIICYCGELELHSLERYFSLKLNVITNGLNLFIVGDDQNPQITSDEVKDKIGIAHRGKKLSEYQKERFCHYWNGRKQSQEHVDKRKKCGKDNGMYGNKGYWAGKQMPIEVREKLSKSRKGKHLLGDNGNAKKVIDVSNGRIYNSAKELSIILGINYSTFKAILKRENSNYKYV